MSKGTGCLKVLSWFLSYFSSRGGILLSGMCFGIKILSPFHLDTQMIPFQNNKFPKNPKNTCADMIFIPAGGLDYTLD